MNHVFCRDCRGEGHLVTFHGQVECPACKGKGRVPQSQEDARCQAEALAQGAALRAWRRDSHLTMGQLARAFGVGVADVSAWENDQVPVPARVLHLVSLVPGNTYRFVTGDKPVDMFIRAANGHDAQILGVRVQDRGEKSELHVHVRIDQVIDAYVSPEDLVAK